MECLNRLESSFKKYKRIISIGDIHGDFDVFIKSLLLGGVIDINNKWISSNTIVIQLGDQVDSVRAELVAKKKEFGRFSFFKINNLIKKLDKQARKKNSRIVSLLGNHEIMNLIGDFRYTGNTELLQTTDDINSSEKDMIENRKKYFLKNKDLRLDFACNRNMIIKIGSWLFVHGGLILEIIKEYNIEQINKIASNFILGKKMNPIDIKKILDYNPKSPIWNRDFGVNNVDCKYLYKTLKFLNLKHMVIGHTIQSKGINSKCSNSLWRIDIGLSNRKFSNDIDNVEVLEIIDDGVEINVLKYSEYLLYQNIINSKLEYIKIHDINKVKSSNKSNYDVRLKNKKIEIKNEKYNFLKLYIKKN